MFLFFSILRRIGFPFEESDTGPVLLTAPTKVSAGIAFPEVSVPETSRPVSSALIFGSVIAPAQVQPALLHPDQQPATVKTIVERQVRP